MSFLGVRVTRREPWEVSDELWAVIEPLLPRRERRYRYPGRKRIDDRKTLQGILSVLHTGIQREYLPQEPGFGADPTCWRRLAVWQQAGVWAQLQHVLLDRLRAANRLDFSRAAIDSSRVPAKRGRSRPKVCPSPVDRGRPGSKHHVLTDGGTVRRVSLTGGHRNDVTQLLPLIDTVPPVRGRRGRPRRKPRALYADRGYDHGIYRRRLRRRNIVFRIAHRGQAHGSGPGRIRWVAEAAIAHLHGPRRLRVRWETHDDMHDAFLQLAGAPTDRVCAGAERHRGVLLDRTDPRPPDLAHRPAAPRCRDVRGGAGGDGHRSVVGNLLTGNVALPGRFPGGYCLVWAVRGVLLAAFGLSSSLLEAAAIATTASTLVPLTSISLNTEIDYLPGPERLRVFTTDSALLVQRTPPGVGIVSVMDDGQTGAAGQREVVYAAAGQCTGAGVVDRESEQPAGAEPVADHGQGLGGVGVPEGALDGEAGVQPGQCGQTVTASPMRQNRVGRCP